MENLGQEDRRVYARLQQLGMAAAAREFLDRVHDSNDNAASALDSSRNETSRQEETTDRWPLEHFFEESSRTRDLNLFQGDVPDDAVFAEVSLIERRWESLLLSGWTMSDLVAFLAPRGYPIAWLTRRTFVTTFWNYELEDMMGRRARSLDVTIFHFCNDIRSVYVVCIGEGVLPTRAFRFLSQGPNSRLSVGTLLIHGQPTMTAELLEVFRDRNFDRIKFNGLDFPFDCCRELGAFRGSLECNACELQDRGRAIFQAIALNQGPSELTLDNGGDDLSLIQAALQQSTTLRRLYVYTEQQSENELLQFLRRGLAENRSLVEFGFGRALSDNVWDALFLAVKNHPTIQKLHIGYAGPPDEDTPDNRVRASRVIVDMLRENTVVTELTFVEEQDEDDDDDDEYPQDERSAGRFDRDVLEHEIYPRLKANRYHARVKSLLGENDATFQSRLVGAALSQKHVRSSSAATWLLVSNFHKVVSEMHESVQEGKEPASKKARIESSD